MRRAWLYSAAASSARARLSPSALLTAIMSAISSKPFLMPCSSSPAPGSISTRKKSTMPATATSDWPTPTVSTRMTSKPAASQSAMVSRVARVTPPKVPAEGEGRTNAAGSTDRRCMRVLSPRIEPPLRVLEGSTASTATRRPSSVRTVPKASMKVLLPTPGTPVMPIRWARPVRGAIALSKARAAVRCAGLRLSTSVMARPSAVRSPATTPAARAAASGPAGRRSADRRSAVGEGELMAFGLPDHRPVDQSRVGRNAPFRPIKNASPPGWGGAAKREV